MIESVNPQLPPALPGPTSNSDELRGRFLTLLVTQMRNQDPLNPMDGSQMTAQMAQLSSVAGIEQLNQSVGQLARSMSGSGLLAAAQSIGRAALLPGDSLHLADGRATGAIELEGPTSAARITVRDGAGAVVDTLHLGARPAGVSTFQWQPMGRIPALPEGSYRMSLETGGDLPDGAGRPLSAALIEGIRQQPSGLVLLLKNRGEVPLSSIRQIS